MGSQWGYDQLMDAVKWLNPQAKQAFYAAAASRTINRDTWNGCAFNAGAAEIGTNGVASISKAAEVFGIPEKSVSRFISVWDRIGGTADKATTRLREAIETVGLFSPRGTLKIRSFSTVIREANEEAERAALDTIENLIANPEITDEALWGLIDGYKEAMEVLV